MSTMAEYPAAANRNIGLAVLATFCTCVVALIFLTNWPTYHFTVRNGPVALYYYLLPSALLVPLLCAEPRLAVRFFRDPVFWWFVVYTVSGLVWLLNSQDFIEDSTRYWRLRLLSFSIFYAMALYITVSKRAWVALAILCCVALACALNWFDVLRPEIIVPKGVIEGVDQAGSGRGAGTFIDANAGCAFIVMGTITALIYVPRALRALVLVGALLGVAAAFSRSGYILFTVAALTAMALGLINRKQSWLLILGIPLLVSVITMSYDFLMEHSENRYLHDVIQRLSWFEAPDITDEAVEGRAHGAAVAWRMFLENPVLGAGLGATGRDIIQEAPHNIYLELMAEQGIFGLIMYVSLIFMLLRRGWRIRRDATTHRGLEIGKATLLFAIVLSVHGLFIHNVLREAYTVFLLAFIVAAGSETARLEREALTAAAAPRRRLAGSGAAG